MRRRSRSCRRTRTTRTRIKCNRGGKERGSAQGWGTKVVTVSSVPVPHSAPCVSFETLHEVCAFLENPLPTDLARV